MFIHQSAKRPLFVFGSLYEYQSSIVYGRWLLCCMTTILNRVTLNFVQRFPTDVHEICSHTSSRLLKYFLQQRWRWRRSQWNWSNVKLIRGDRRVGKFSSGTKKCEEHWMKRVKSHCEHWLCHSWNQSRFLPFNVCHRYSIMLCIMDVYD